MSQFDCYFRWDDYFAEKSVEDVDPADIDQHNERGAIGDNEHQRSMALNVLRVWESASRSSIVSDPSNT